MHWSWETRSHSRSSAHRDDEPVDEGSRAIDRRCGDFTGPEFEARSNLLVRIGVRLSLLGRTTLRRRHDARESVVFTTAFYD